MRGLLPDEHHVARSPAPGAQPDRLCNQARAPVLPKVSCGSSVPSQILGKRPPRMQVLFKVKVYDRNLHQQKEILTGKSQSYH